MSTEITPILTLKNVIHQMQTIEPEFNYMLPFTEREVISTFVNLKNSSIFNIIGIHMKPLKVVIYLLAPIPLGIFNIVIEKSTFPSLMQNAKVRHKGGDINTFTVEYLHYQYFAKGSRKLYIPD